MPSSEGTRPGVLLCVGRSDDDRCQGMLGRCLQNIDGIPTSIFWVGSSHQSALTAAQDFAAMLAEASVAVFLVSPDLLKELSDQHGLFELIDAAVGKGVKVAWVPLLPTEIKGSITYAWRSRRRTHPESLIRISSRSGSAPGYSTRDSE